MLIFGEQLRTHQGLQNNENDKEKEFNEWIESYKHSVPLSVSLFKSLKQYLKFSDVCPFGL
jgi:hypothetical protein